MDRDLLKDPVFLLSGGQVVPLDVQPSPAIFNDCWGWWLAGRSVGNEGAIHGYGWGWNFPHWNILRASEIVNHQRIDTSCLFLAANPAPLEIVSGIKYQPQLASRKSSHEGITSSGLWDLHLQHSSKWIRCNLLQAAHEWHEWHEWRMVSQCVLALVSQQILTLLKKIVTIHHFLGGFNPIFSKYE